MKRFIPLNFLALICTVFCSEWDGWENHDCPENFTYQYHGFCGPRCDTGNKPPEVCPLVIVEGCDCIEGYIPVDGTRERCVKPEDCPETDSPGNQSPGCGFPEPNYNCKGNTTLGYYNYCDPKCDNYKEPKGFCPESLTKGCVCKDGYIRLDDNRDPLVCVKPDDCPCDS